jgi:hypothetical protein
LTENSRSKSFDVVCTFLEQSKNGKEKTKAKQVTEKINKCPTKVILHLR